MRPEIFADLWPPCIGWQDPPEPGESGELRASRSARSAGKLSSENVLGLCHRLRPRFLQPLIALAGSKRSDDRNRGLAVSLRVDSRPRKRPGTRFPRNRERV